MPRYDYECTSCHHVFEMRQSFDSEPVAKCPECSNQANRKFHAVPIVFKGSGFYVNDYGKNSSFTSKSSEAKDSSSESSSSDSKDSSGSKDSSVSKGSSSKSATASKAGPSFSESGSSSSKSTASSTE